MIFFAFLDNFTDLAKWAEWIAAIFGFLAWATGHPATAAWAIGAVLVLAVFRKGWPFANVPDINSFPGKALLTVGLVLIVGGFGWRALDQIVSREAKNTHAIEQAHPTPEQRGVRSEPEPNGG